MEISYAGALFAGILSFLSPCVLPLVPPYLCFLAGTSLEELTDNVPGEDGVALRVFSSALLFVLGFSTVFVSLGATASVFGNLISDVFLRKTLADIPGLDSVLGGIPSIKFSLFSIPIDIPVGSSPIGVFFASIVIILMGLHFLGVFRFSILNREARYHHKSRPAGFLGAYAVGLAFGFGWTPCIGPVLAVILTIAAGSESVSYGSSLLAVYSLGLGVPFLIAALAAKPFLGFMKKFRSHVGTVEKAMGGLLVLTGVMFLTGTMSALSYFLLDVFPALGTIG